MSKKTPVKNKKNVLEGISKVTPATKRDLEKEAARSLGRIQEGSLEQDFSDFSSLIESRGWKRLVFINQENARLLGEQVLNKRDNEGEPLSEIECDRLRDQRDAILEFIEFPKKFISNYQEFHAPDIEDDIDPYETGEQATKREIIERRSLIET